MLSRDNHAFSYAVLWIRTIYRHTDLAIKKMAFRSNKYALLFMKVKELVGFTDSKDHSNYVMDTRHEWILD